MPIQAETLEARVERLARENQQLREDLDRYIGKPKSSVVPEQVEKYLKMALVRCENDSARATNLFLAWCDQDSQVRNSLQPIIREALESRLNDLRD